MTGIPNPGPTACPNCGTWRPAGAIFCPVCGRALDATTSAAGAGSGVRGPSRPRYLSGLLILGLGLFGLGLVVIADALLVSVTGGSHGAPVAGAIHTAESTSSPSNDPSLQPSSLPSALPTDPLAGTFIRTGGFCCAYNHTVTLLADGRVLIAGGGVSEVGNGEVGASLYDPATGEFTRTGDMAKARTYATATRLGDGRVLVAGGENARNNYLRGWLSGSEIYDPQTGKFTPAGSMTKAYGSVTATLLLDGRVLIAGEGTADLYDPNQGSLRATGAMKANRHEHTATLLRDGRVLITGGSDPGGGVTSLDSAELYDAATGSFTATGSMIVSRAGHTATLLTDGRVLVEGGHAGDQSAELYDPKTGTFTKTGSLLDSRRGHTATLLPNGRVLIAGGSSVGEIDGPGFTSSAELYDPTTASFSETGQMLVNHTGHTATLLSNGRVLIVGGAGSGPAELFVP